MELNFSTVLILILAFCATAGLAYMIYVFIRIILSPVTDRKVDEFFRVHRTATGEVIKFIHESGRSYTAYEFQGKYRPSKPALRNIPARYFVKLKCTHGRIRYEAVYKIFPQDYSRLSAVSSPGTIIDIPSSWEPHGYKII